MSSNPARAPEHEASLKKPGISPKLQLFSTCPSSLLTPENYLDRIVRVARWSEDAGCTGILIYTDNTLVDPWLVAHVIIQTTSALCPLVAVQPVYMHPYTPSNLLSTFVSITASQLFL